MAFLTFALVNSQTAMNVIWLNVVLLVERKVNIYNNSYKNTTVIKKR